jgi:hypothetical protein
MNKPHPVPLYATVIVFLAVLFFGLNPKGYDFSNHVSRLDDGPGIRFDKYGLAYAELDSTLRKRIDAREGFSILMVFQSERLDNNGSGHILTLHPGKDEDQLIIWQWYSHIIAMNGNDYAHRRKTGRVSYKIPSSPAQQIFLSLTSGKSGTSLYFDGKVVSSNHSLHLDFPVGAKETLILGNSPYGNGSWQGDISGLALFDRELPPETVASLYNAWSLKRSFADAKKENPFLLYLFNEKEWHRIIDHSGNSTPLLIPAQAAPLRKRFLDRSLSDSGITGGLAQDVIVNLTGFIPLGFFFAYLLVNLGGTPGKRVLFYTVVFCFALSLAIELLQAWIPSRSSQFLDLFLNTSGGFTGAALSNLRILKRYLN